MPALPGPLCARVAGAADGRRRRVDDELTNEHSGRGAHPWLARLGWLDLTASAAARCPTKCDE